MMFKEYLKSTYTGQSTAKGKRNLKFRKAAFCIIFATRLKNKMKEYRHVDRVNLKDNVLRKLIFQSLRFDENHVTASFIEEINMLLKSSHLN